MKTNTEHFLIKATQNAFLWARIFNMPCWCLMCMLSIILYKEMHISPLQITVIIALKPISALFAPYWSLSAYKNPNRIISNIILANNLQYIPLLFFPWITSPWLIIFFFGIYMVLNRGVIPHWMEILKKNIPPITRERTFSYGSIVDYLGNVLLPVGLGVFLDHYHLAWMWAFPIAAGAGLCSTYFLSKIPFSDHLISENSSSNEIYRFQLLEPIKRSWKLLNQRPDFTRFQLGFMLGGGGLMVMQPALPPFFVDILNLSFTQMGIAIAAFKGIGFVLTAPVWARLFREWNIYKFSGMVTILASLFPIILMFSKFHMAFLCFAYFVYGIMQAGSELSWHMSGPIFSKEEDSTIYSSTNILAVGIRGCIFPFLGAMICSLSSTVFVMLLGAFLCLLASFTLMAKRDNAPYRTEAA